MSAIIAQRNEARESQSLMIMTMEKKLNAGSYGLWRFNYRRDRNISKISIA